MSFKMFVSAGGVICLLFPVVVYLSTAGMLYYGDMFLIELMSDQLNVRFVFGRSLFL